jgi:hypothetical protein
MCGKQGKGISQFESSPASGMVYPQCVWRACPPQAWVAQSDLIALCLKPCALNHSCFIIRDASGAPRASPPHFLADKPVAPINFADSLCERRDLVARHPDRNPDYKRPGLKPWLSAVGTKPFIKYCPECLPAHLRRINLRRGLLA